jgi:hypothetical protein
MERFVRRQNIEHYKELLKTIDDPVKRAVIEKLLQEEEHKLKSAEAKSKKT